MEVEKVQIDKDFSFFFSRKFVEMMLSASSY
jgi:hypothetical protein